MKHEKVKVIFNSVTKSVTTNTADRSLAIKKQLTTKKTRFMR